MSEEFPDRETIRSALMLATRAPSVHNSQPWRWRVGDDSLHLYSDRDLHLRHTDPDTRDLMLSCGAALNHLVVAFAALGWQSTVHRFPNPADTGHLAAIELDRWLANRVDIALAAAIPMRRTDRRNYSSWLVPQGDIALMGARAALAGVTLRRVKSVSGLAQVMAEAARQHAADHDYMNELHVWSGRHASPTGVPARNTPEPDPHALVPGRVFAGAALTQTPDGISAQDTDVVLALGTTDDDAMSRLRAGEAMSLVLLTATSAGLATCPMTEPLEIADLRAIVRRDIFGDSLFPQMLLRVGWAPVNADPLPATPRRDLAEVVAQLDGSPFEEPR